MNNLDHWEMNKNNKQKDKIPRSIVIANNKKQAEIKNVLILRDEMEKNSIDPKLIKKFLDEQYDSINKKHQERISKFNEKQKSLTDNKLLKDIKKKKDKAIEFLLKNKAFLEEKGASKEYIKKYVEKQYEEINEYYSIDNFMLINQKNEIDNDLADFID